METYLWISLFGPLILVVICVRISWRAAKEVHGPEDYLLFGKGLTPEKFSNALFATSVSLGSIFVALAAQTVLLPIIGVALLVSWIAGLWLLWRVYSQPVVKSFLTNADGGRTIFQFVGDQYNSPRLRRYSAWTSIIIYILSVGAEIFVFVLILRAIGLPDAFLIPATVLITLGLVCYVTISGMRGTINTEKVQKWAILLGVATLGILLLILSYFLKLDYPQLPENTRIPTLGQLLFLNTDPVDLAFLAFASFLLLFPFYIGAMDSWQRIAALHLASRDCHNSPHSGSPDAIIRSAFKRNAVLLSLVGAVPILFGVAYIILFGNQVPQNHYTALVDPILLILLILSDSAPTAMIFLVIVFMTLILTAFTAAVISTADTLLVCVSYSYFYDVQGCDSRELPTHEKVLFARRAVIFGGCFSLLIWILLLVGFDLKGIIWALFSGISIFSIPLFMVVFLPRFSGCWRGSALCSIVFGFSLLILTFLIVFLSRVPLENKDDAAPIAAFTGISGCIVLFVASNTVAFLTSWFRRRPR